MCEAPHRKEQGWGVKRKLGQGPAAELPPPRPTLCSHMTARNAEGSECCKGQSSLQGPYKGIFCQGKRSYIFYVTFLLWLDFNTWLYGM